MTLGEAETKAKDRAGWRNLVVTLCSARSEEDSESESGNETDIGDHVDHSEIPPSQSILQPTDAITDTSTEIKFQRKVFQLLLELWTGLNDLAGRPIQNVGAGVCPLPDLLTSKADTEEDFNNINELLKRPQEKKTMIEHLKRIGGSDYKDNVQKILRRVMSNELQAKYNMKGNRGKLNFESTEICKVIVETAKNLFSVTEHNILQVTAACLKYAPDRMGGGGRKKKSDAAAGIVAANNGNGEANNANGAANNGNGDANNRDGADDRQ
ncbi:uncharacterized protein LOC127731918 [Mytilus californianus]|uniref:uncharacterized protein LOC127731918 n=1 Tax=Mytilus californianus TaxID=6549 RepID=UPI002246E394|nr:uncharacterized protein LOC127731918 [Mytilus californianus]